MSNTRSHVITAVTVAVLASVVALAIGAPTLEAQQGATRQSLDDAWWTGPMLANSAAALPRGHFLVEPYLYDVNTRGAFDGDGVRRAAPVSHGLGSLTYIIYGLTDRVSLGLVPTAGYNVVRDGPSSSAIGLGDASLLFQYGVTRFREGSEVPATAVSLQESFPTGKYDRLGARAGDGMGRGAYTTTLAFYSQMYFWLPNGRLFRMRFDASEGLSRSVGVRDVSVYGTHDGFRGRADPGSTSFLDLSSEYSVTRRWVLALDVTYQHARRTAVTGYDVSQSAGAQNLSSVLLTSGPSDGFGLSPAVEYSWTSRLGVLLGARVIAAGRNTDATITPALAINIVH
jgi:hypothetical protein